MSLSHPWLPKLRFDKNIDVTPISKSHSSPKLPRPKQKILFFGRENQENSTDNKNYGGSKTFRIRSYAIKVGSYTKLSVKIPLFQGIFCHASPDYMACFGVTFFADMGGGGCRNV